MMLPQETRENQMWSASTPLVAPLHYAQPASITRDQVKDMIGQAMESFVECQCQENEQFRISMKNAITTQFSNPWCYSSSKYSTCSDVHAWSCYCPCTHTSTFTCICNSWTSTTILKPNTSTSTIIAYSRLTMMFINIFVFKPSFCLWQRGEKKEFWLYRAIKF